MTIHVFPWGTAGDFCLLSPPFACPQFFQVQMMEPSKKKVAKAKVAFVLRANLTFFSSLCRMWQTIWSLKRAWVAEPHSLSDIKKQRGAEMRYFFLVKWLCLLNFAVWTDPCSCAAPGMFCVLYKGEEDMQTWHLGTWWCCAHFWA